MSEGDRRPRRWRGGWSGGWLPALALLLPAPAAGQQTSGAVHGTVRDSTGIGIAGATVAPVGGAQTVQSGRDGAFRLTALPAGPIRLAVRRLGFRPDTVMAIVAAGGVTEVAVRLRALAQQLAAVEVRERHQAYDARLAGLRERMEKRRGYFLTPERMRRSTSPMLTDMLREVPGVRISRSSANLPRSVRIRGNRCPPLVFIDGFPAGAGEFDLDMIDPASVEAVEVHPSIATMPAEFGAARGLERCGVIAIWSRPAPPRLPRIANRPRGGTPNLERLVEQGQVYTAAQVDEEARIDSAAAAAYPDSLWDAEVGGRVVMEFVVSAGGAIEPSTLRVVSSTHAAFTQAVQVALETASFHPARRGGRAVRQVVQLPFVFTPPDGDG